MHMHVTLFNLHDTVHQLRVGLILSSDPPAPHHIRYVVDSVE